MSDSFLQLLDGLERENRARKGAHRALEIARGGGSRVIGSDGDAKPAPAQQQPVAPSSARSFLARIKNEVETSVRASPWTWLAVALGAGAALAYLWRRRTPSAPSSAPLALPAPTFPTTGGS